MFDDNKRYYSANEFFRNKFDCKIIKIAVDAGFTCPNRDGTLSRNGCIFCSGQGSGDFSGEKDKPIDVQFEEMKKIMSKKWTSGKYMLYFQAFSNTYAPLYKLKQLYNKALDLENVVAVSIATRPDCINDDIAAFLYELSKKIYICIELGLQTSNEKSAEYINRCYKNEIFERTMNILKKYNIDVICHIILGLPNETKQDMLNSIQYVIKNNIDGIKLQLLHVLRGTRLEEIYKKENFKILTLEEYADIVVSCIEILPKNIVLHRITGDGPKDILIEPLWSKDKKRVLNKINQEFIKRNTFQSNKF